MKWVHMGVVQSVGFIAVAAYLDRKHALEILAGGGTAIGLLYGQYWHAKEAGLSSGAPGTEKRY